MNRIDLHDRVAVITGGAPGLGYATALRMLDSGASVTLWDFDSARLEQARAELQERWWSSESRRWQLPGGHPFAWEDDDQPITQPGAYQNNKGHLRCGSQSWVDPCYRTFNQGFRVVWSPRSLV